MVSISGRIRSYGGNLAPKPSPDSALVLNQELFATLLDVLCLPQQKCDAAEGAFAASQPLLLQATVGPKVHSALLKQQVFFGRSWWTGEHDLQTGQVARKVRDVRDGVA